MQLFGISSLLFLTFQGPVQALKAATACTTTADCAWGEACVAGDSDTAAQACVPFTVCGGSSMGNCPSDDSGRLVCLWRPYSDCSEGCAVLQGNKGVNKCVSLSRCDAYYGGTSCSGGCSVNGVQCNGHGSCNMVSLSPSETPNFSCTCEKGYSGNKCEFPPKSTKAPSTNSSSIGNGDSIWKILDDDDSGTEDVTADGSSRGGSTDTPDDRFTKTSKTSSSSDGPSSDNLQKSDASRSSTSGSSEVAESKSTTRGDIHTWWLIFILVSVAVIMLSMALFVVCFKRKRKQQQAEEYTNALASAQGVGAVGLRDLAAGHTGDTPRARTALV
ncbi:unnamed protein product [Peronospora destructor]|uniref:EGF-like domain-containing protein n=1 Tax=Peronospora destructor TaxID=86335 RepID=A0AAV0VDI6_9STRA|nr:unnamed protein product [Peronospora destructor]